MLRSLVGSEMCIRDRFVPDTHLGHYVQEQLNRKMIIWDGYCPTHSRIRDVDIVREKKDHPNAKIMSHPECPQNIRDISDYLLSTGQMLEHAKNSDEDEFIVATEMGLLYRLRNDNPSKKFYSVSDRALCPNMKKIDLEKILDCLENDTNEIILDNKTIEAARKSVIRMTEIGR